MKKITTTIERGTEIDMISFIVPDNVSNLDIIHQLDKALDDINPYRDDYYTYVELADKVCENNSAWSWKEYDTDVYWVPDEE